MSYFSTICEMLFVVNMLNTIVGDMCKRIDM